MPLWVLLFLLFFSLIILRVPISVALGMASVICLVIIDVPLNVVAQRMFTSLDSFGIMAIPFFVLAGNLMADGGISRKLTDLASALLGTVRGGLAMGGVLACGFFAALSGSAPATVIAIGSMLYGNMVARGYPKEETAGLFCIAGGLGPLIPPSIIMVMYGTITNTSVSDMFIAGAGLGVIIMLVLMILTYFRAKQNNWPREHDRFDVQRVKKAFFDSILAIIMPLIVLGGIYGGIFTPTEAACVSVVYALIVSIFIYKEISIQALPLVLRRSATAAAMVLFILATSNVFAWLFVYAGFTKLIVGEFMALNVSPLIFLLMMTVVILIFGTFMDSVAIMVLLMPLFKPIADSLAVHPIHLGMVVSLGIVVGCFTPPVASNIYASAAVSKLPMEKIVRGQMPYFLVMICVLTAVIFVPSLSTFLLR